MKRLHLFEFHDLNWFPTTWRDLFTDFLSYLATTQKPYVPVAELLSPILEKSEDPAIVDLCSGAGIPIVTVIDSLNENIASKIRVTLTDKYPNISALSHISKESNGTIKFIDDSIDATDVPEDLKGFRTFFGSFHHFKEEPALAILTDAVIKNQGIGIFEFTDRNLIFRIPPFFMPLQVWIKTIFIRPFRWRRILWTYLIPVLPIVAFWDGFVSCLRVYSQSELKEFVKEFEDHPYSWQIGQIKTIGPLKITYLIGCPNGKGLTSCSSYQVKVETKELVGSHEIC